jgi:hypothetical protein
MSRFLLILLLGSFVTIGIISTTQNQNITNATENSAQSYSQTKARNAANSTVQMLMSQVADNENWRQTTPQTISIFGGSATYTVTDANHDGKDVVKYSVTSNINGESKQIIAYTAKNTSGLPGGIKGAITTNNPVQTLGGLNVDGRNHKMDGTLVPSSGSYAIWSTNTVTQSGSSDLGGTSGTTDFVPSNPGHPSIIAENQIYPGGFPNSPDKVLGGALNGFPDGTLKSIAQSGLNGSQYITDPKNVSLPLSGVTYLELDGKKDKDRTWQSMDISGSGILIVHNSSTSTIMKNVNKGTFAGLMIVDDMVHIHADIIGAVVALTPSPSSGNCIGNGNGNVLYSTEAIQSAFKQIGINGSSLNYGFGNNRLHITNWLE